jgi:5'-AMP-activated protein kinase regulatory beta subunit
MARSKTNRQQTFSITAPKALSVQLVGDFTRWQEEAIEMDRQKDGAWKTSVTLAPGTYHYRFIVAGEWRDDPACALCKTNSFGSEDAVRQVA